MGLVMLLTFWFSFTEDFGVDSLVDQYGLKGTSIRLYISDRNQSTDVTWRRPDIKFRQILADSSKNGVSPFYKNRMEFDISDGSLTIKNLQKSDSGIYKALLSWEEETLAEFNLTVENEVSKPLIQVNYDFNSSTEVCQTSVNCSADGSWATYDCNQSYCAQTLAVSLASINITVTVLNNGHVQCQATNHVSTSTFTKNIMCQKKQFHSGFLFWIIVAICVGVGLGLLLGLMMGLHFKKKNSSKVYPKSSTAVVGGTANEQGLETIYSTVQKPNTSQTPPGNNTDINIEGTIYDIPFRHPKVHQANTVEINQEQQRPREDKTVKVRATVHQVAEPDSEQINTVYCKLGEI